MSRKNLMAVNRVIAEAGLAKRPEYGAVVQFARDCARRLDAVGTADAPVTLLSEYRGALRDLRRAAKDAVSIARAEMGSKRARDGVAEAPDALDRLRQKMRRLQEERAAAAEYDKQLYERKQES